MTEDKICEFPYELIIGDTHKLTSDYLVKQFKNAIVTGALSSGCMLPNENTLCEKLGVGRSTLREAFKVLSVYGLIKRTKHGTYVNSIKDFNTSFLIDYNFEESDTKELMEFRIIFESETAFIAAQKATTEDIMELKKLIIKMEGCRDNISALSYYDAEFHSRIAYSTHNKLIMSIMKLISDTYYKGIKHQFEKIDHIGALSTYDATMQFHNRIFDSILLKNSEEASKAMREHLSCVMDELV